MLHGETVVAGEIYTRQEFLKRIGRSEAAWRTLRKSGLPIIRLSGGVFVRAEAWIEFAARFEKPDDGTLIEAEAEPATV